MPLPLRRHRGKLGGFWKSQTKRRYMPWRVAGNFLDFLSLAKGQLQTAIA